jgi:cytoskeletal protein CcmA (bactofilin family)
MFSNRSKETTAAPLANPLPALQVQKRSSRCNAAPSIIGADLVVTGTLTSNGDIQIDGKVEGNVHSISLTIGDKAYIEGDVVADEVVVRGRIKGGIRARKVLLTGTCHVEGDILHETFAVESGAFFEGNCRHAEYLVSDAPVEEHSGGPSSTPVAEIIPRMTLKSSS